MIISTDIFILSLLLIIYILGNNLILAKEHSIIEEKIGEINKELDRTNKRLDDMEKELCKMNKILDDMEV